MAGHGQAMRVVILAGGHGTRLAEETRLIPKPMVTIGGIPILGHIIRNFADQGFRDFGIAGGYKWEVIRDWLEEHIADLTDINITVSDTGLETQTGGRVARMQAGSTDPFLLTYGDGLADINYATLLDHHARMLTLAEEAAAKRPLVTLTAVNPPSRFGRLRIEDGYCKIFTEKGQDPDGWINAGFYICDPHVLRLIPGDGCVWEKDILPTLALQGRLAAYQHTGEFQMMDTWRDCNYLEELWQTGRAFWTRWKPEE